MCPRGIIRSVIKERTNALDPSQALEDEEEHLFQELMRIRSKRSDDHA